MNLPLTKTLDPADYGDLAEELKTVDEYFTTAREQDPMRRWEYALALHALRQWHTDHEDQSRRVVDVGGAGSPFHRIVQARGWLATVIDPEVNYDLATYLRRGPSLVNAVTCLSVLEHVEDLDRFLYHLNCLVAPGGLLFLTMDCWNKDGEDTAHFYWMRKRIFTLYQWKRLSLAGPVLGDFTPYGEADWTYHGNHVYDYSFASLALVKRS